MPVGGAGKTFVAAAILQAVDDGVLNLDTPIEKWLGRQLWFPRLPNASTLTLRLLLGHRSGVPDLSGTDAVMKAMATNVNKRWTSFELVAFVWDQKPVSRAGTRYFYSDMNYVIAGAVFERAVGRPLFSEIDRRILQSSGLPQTAPAERREFSGVAAGRLDMTDGRYATYGLKESSILKGQFTYNPQFQWAAGAMLSTSQDLARWATLLWTGRVFSATRLTEMVDGKPSEKDARYGLGTQIVSSARGPIYVHDGWTPGYQTTMLRLPDQRLSAAIQVSADQQATFTMTPDVLLGQLVGWVLRQPK